MGSEDGETRLLHPMRGLLYPMRRMGRARGRCAEIRLLLLLLLLLKELLLLLLQLWLVGRVMLVLHGLLGAAHRPNNATTRVGGCGRSLLLLVVHQMFWWDGAVRRRWQWVVQLLLRRRE